MPTLQPKIARHRGPIAPPMPVGAPVVSITAPNALAHQQFQQNLEVSTQARRPYCAAERNNPNSGHPGRLGLLPGPADRNVWYGEGMPTEEDKRYAAFGE